MREFTNYKIQKRSDFMINKTCFVIYTHIRETISIYKKFRFKFRLQQIFASIFIIFMMVSLLPTTFFALSGTNETFNILETEDELSTDKNLSIKVDSSNPHESKSNSNKLDRKEQFSSEEIKSYQNQNFLDPRFSNIPIYNKTDVTNQIKANESFILENSINNIAVNNSYNDDILFQNISNIEFPTSGFINNSQSFSIENVTTIFSYDQIEFEESNFHFISTSSMDTPLPDEIWDYQSVATSFTVEEPAVNITQIKLSYGTSDAGSLSGEAYISGLTGGIPNNTKIGGQVVDLTSDTGEVLLDFPNPVTLTSGTYVIVVNETSSYDDENYFSFKAAHDVDDDGANESQMWNKLWGGSWATRNWDLFFSYEFIPLNPSNFSEVRQYTSPQELQLKYNDTYLVTFNDNNLLLDGNLANFISNSSIIFDLSYNINYESSNNPITVSTLLSVNNGSSPFWNTSFTHNKIPDGSYNINQRNLTMFNLPADWNNSLVLQNGSDFVSVNYTNGSSELILHLDQDSDPYSWLLQFQSPNYLSDFALAQNGTPITAPYQVNTSDILTFIANLSISSYNGKNASIMVYDFNYALNYSEIDQDVINDDIIFSPWIISNNLSTQTHVNGSYQVIISWLGENGTQVGYFGLDIEIITQTILQTPSSMPNTQIGLDIPFSVNFLSTQNSSTIDNVPISYTTTWGQSGFLIQTIPGMNYTNIISTTSADEGIGTINLSTSLFGYVNHSIELTIVLLRNTSIQTTVNTTTLYYKDVVEVYINYQNESFIDIPSATIKINGSDANDLGNRTYYYLFNTSSVNPTLSIFVLSITANIIYHVNQTDFLVFSLLSNPTAIILEGFTPNNSIVEKEFSEGIQDSINFSIRYKDDRHGTIIPDAIMSENSSSFITVTGVGIDQDYTNYSWIVVMNPEDGGLFPIKFSLSKDGYNPVFYIITLNITVTQTQLLIGGSQPWEQNGNYSINFQEQDLDNFSFYLALNDSVYNQLLLNPGLNVNNSNIDTSSIDLSLNSSFLSLNGTVIYTVNPLKTGSFTLIFSLNRTGYMTQTLVVNIMINISITKLFFETGPTSWINSSVVPVVFDNLDRDNLTIRLYMNDTVYGLYLNSSLSFNINPAYQLWIDSSFNNGTFIVMINPLQYGQYDLSFSLNKTGYVIQVLEFRIDVQLVSTNILYGGSLNWANETVFNLTFSEVIEDNFTVYIRYNDRNHSVLLNHSLNYLNSSFLDITTNVNYFPANSTWSINFDPHIASIIPLVFFMNQSGYQSQTIIIYLDVSPASFNLNFTINNPQEVGFGSQETLKVNLTNVFDSKPIIGAGISLNDSVFLWQDNLDGSYNITYIGATQWYIGSYSFPIQFYKTNFNPKSILLNYTIIETSIFPTQIIANSSTVTSEWGDITYLNITFNDPLHNIYLDINSFQSNISQSDVSIELLSARGNYHLFSIIPKSVGNWNLNLTFNANLPLYFQNQSYIFTITANKRSTAIEISYINANNGKVDVVYNRYSDIGIIWTDSELPLIANSTFIEGQQIILDNTPGIWLKFLNRTESSGIHYFRIYGVSMIDIDGEFIFDSILFESYITNLDIHVILLPTNDLIINTASGILTDSTNHSKFGYTVNLSFEWVVTDNNTIIHNPDIVILYNGTELTENRYPDYGIFVENNSTSLSSQIWISFFSSNNFSRGYSIDWHQFEFLFDSYGLVPKRYIWNIFTEGYNFNAGITYDERFIAGSIYTITIQLTYANSTSITIDTTSVDSLRFQTIPEGSLLGNSVQNIPIEFEIELLLINGSTITLSESITTNTEGEVIFVIPSQITQYIDEFKNINIKIAGTSNSEQLNFDVDTEKLPVVELQNGGLGLEILAIAIIITALVISTSLFVFNKRRTGKEKKYIAKKQKVTASQERIDLISNIYTILVTVSSGLPIYSLVNSLYRDSPTTRNIISGLSVGIDHFLSSFQADFMEQLGEQITDKKQVEISTIQRKDFQIFIFGTLTFRIFVFLKETPPQFALDIFRDISSELETKLKLNIEEVLDDTNTPRVEHIIRQHFPLTLLSTFLIDPNRLLYIEKEIRKKKGNGPKITLEALLAIKQLALIRTGKIRNLKASPQELSKEFDNLHKKGELGEIGILHYDIAYNMLKNALKLPVETVLETLWTASSKEVLILIPFAEDVIPISQESIDEAETN